MLVAVAACSDDDTATGVPETVVSMSNIAGVTPPAFTQTPVSSITPTAQYTGTAVWEPDHSTFILGTNYTATITLTPQPGFTLDGVSDDFFEVSGKAQDGGSDLENTYGVTESYTSGSDTVRFLSAVVWAGYVTLTNIPGVAYPTNGAVPVTNITANPQYSGTVSWQPDHSTFMAGTNYTATITLTIKDDRYVLHSGMHVAGATNVNVNVHGESDSAVITAIFPPARN